VADVVALDQTSEPAADASMIAFYENTATTTDALVGRTWVHVFRLVK
jgi:hypothetical protein